MSRHLLPNRRRSEILEFDHEGNRFTLGLSRFYDGRVAEIFIASNRTGSQIEAIARDCAILVSLCLQHGVAIETIADAMRNDWRAKARPEQLPPDGDWSIWILLAGRAYGKTIASAQHIREIADSGQVRHIGLVGQTAAAVRDIMVLGPSGIMSIVPNYNRPTYEPSKACNYFQPRNPSG